jgi:hypothetical protein
MFKGAPYLLLAALVSVPVTACRGEATAAQDTPQAATASAAAQAPQPAPSAKTPAQSNTPVPARAGDCFAIGGVAAREACFATSKEYADCTDEFKCVPYRKMYYAEADLKRLEQRAFELADKSYSGRDMWDKAYYKDLKESFTGSNAAWRSFRDAHCTAEQFYSGMSRREMGDLAEACRLEMTNARIEQMKQLLQGLEPQ